MMAAPDVKTPSEVSPLTEQDLVQVEELVAEIEQWLGQGHDGYMINILLDGRAPARVWEEVLSRVSRAGWKTGLTGVMAVVEKTR
jgi:hypothetical protein